MTKYLLHYDEIGLKAKNRRYFEHILIKNIETIFQLHQISIQKLEKIFKRILLEVDHDQIKVISIIKTIFGIKNFYIVTAGEKTESFILETGQKYLKELSQKGATHISFSTKRSNKDFPLNSMEINTKLGTLASQNNLKVDYKNAPHQLYTIITHHEIFMALEKISAYGGLPVGSSGKCLCLFSGGIDSPVAAWNMLKRGCRIDFLHMHNFRNNQEAYNSKIQELIKIINKYQFSARLFLVPYAPFEAYITGKIPPAFELVYFKHLLLKLAAKWAWRKRYKAIITGDNLAQVASQTLANLRAAQTDINMPIFRPLLTYEKDEIVQRAKQIETFKYSIQSYKDCCSLVSKQAHTQTKLTDFKKIITQIDETTLLEKLLDELEMFEIKGL